MKAIGLDIGTTTICGALIDAHSGMLIDKRTMPNDACICAMYPYERLQDAEKIVRTCFDILYHLNSEDTDIVSVGVTGQMHGIVYVDSNGMAVSPLITWQDGRGECLFSPDKTYAQKLEEETGYHLATGYGALTHFFNTVNCNVPSNAESFCTIADYVAMRLSARRAPLLHSSMAASIGLFSLHENAFDIKAINAAGMRAEMFPYVTSTETSIGCWRGIPVSVGLGDNQASFLGAEQGVGILVNVGTGSQISICGSSPRTFRMLECRPYLGNSFLYVGSSLCGGYAYELLKKFFESVLSLAGVENVELPYDRMNQWGAQYKGIVPRVDTRFNGSRTDPAGRGQITELTAENFRADALTVGVLEGMAEELYGFYREYVQDSDDKGAYIAGSGNGIRNNPLLREILRRRFRKELAVAPYSEEAAYGSALFSLYTAQIYDDWKKLPRRGIC